MMRRSSDNGRTWSTAQIIYQGTTWEPYALQLRSGEIQVYFTDSEPLTADSGTAMLRSMDNGADMDGRWKGDPSKDWTGYRWLGQANLFGSDAFCPRIK